MNNGDAFRQATRTHVQGVASDKRTLESDRGQASPLPLHWSSWHSRPSECNCHMREGSELLQGMRPSGRGRAQTVQHRELQMQEGVNLGPVGLLGSQSAGLVCPLGSHDSSAHSPRDHTPERQRVGVPPLRQQHSLSTHYVLPGAPKASFTLPA